MSGEHAGPGGVRGEAGRSSGMSKGLWVAAGLFVVAALFWQQWRIVELERSEPGRVSESQPVERPETPAESRADRMRTIRGEAANAGPAGAGSGVPPEALAKSRGAAARLEAKHQAVRALGPKETGERMFAELQAVVGTGDEEALQALLEQLLRESRLRREVEEKASRGEVGPQVWKKTVQDLREESDAFARSVLDPITYDRYTDLRKSWSKGRAFLHPDLD